MNVCTMGQELQVQLVEAGRKLSEPPSDITGLLSLLDQIESCLSRVEQSPSKTMSHALVPSMTALVREELLRHSNTDVRVAVASCISEITRITAPNAPYDDALMKEIFQMIVATFEDLSDLGSPSFLKRVSILETVAKVRSCVVMLDLECDALILDMFNHFKNSIREEHSQNIFTAMETIMTLVLEESEEISSDISFFLLSSLRKDNQNVLPVARSLAEKVISNCAAKLKPYLVETVQSMSSLNDYSEVITSLCQESFDNLKHNDVNSCGPHLEEEKPEHVAAAPGEADTTLVKLSKSRMCNGTAKIEKEETMADLHSPKKKSERSRRNNQPQITVSAAKAEPDNLDPEKHAILEATPDNSSKRTRARKSDSVTHSTEVSDHSHEKETVEPLNRKRGHSKEAENLTPQGPPAEETTLPSEHDKVDHSFPVEYNNEAASITSPTACQSLPDTGRPKRVRSGSKVSERKGDEKPVADLPVTPQEPKGTLSGDGDNLVPSADANSAKESEPNKMSEAKPGEVLGKRGDTAPSHEIELLAEEHRKGKREGRKGKSTADKGVAGESTKKKKASPPASAEKTLSKDQKHSEGTPRTASKRKCISGKKEAAGLNLENDELGENLVGSKIKVWWPDDKMFYDGVVESFDPSDKKHKVAYTDGDEEILLLKEEKWELICNGSALDEGTEADRAGSNPSTEKPPKKKAKTSSDSSTKHMREGGSSGKSKIDTTINSSKPEVETPRTGSKPKSETSKGSDKPKSETTKSGSKLNSDISKTARKSKSDTPKADSHATKDSRKSKLETPKTGSKPKLETLKTSGKPELDTPKTSSRSKADATKAGSKSKTATPKSSSKPMAENPKASEKPKLGNAETDDEFKANMPKTNSKSKVATPKTSSNSKAVVSSGKGKSGTEKAQENEAKSGKKRQRGVQG